MYNSTQEMIEALQATPDSLRGLLQHVAPARVWSARGGDEGWSVVEVVCHLRDAEEVFLQRMRMLRDVVEPVIAGFDQTTLASERSYASADLHAALAVFFHLRAVHMAELATLTAAQWERSGQHQQHGSMTIFNHTLHVVWHDAIHTAQIARQLSC